MTIAFLAWNDLGAPDQDPLLSAVHQARAGADVVLVLVHWGREYQRHPTLPQRDLARDLLDAGADVVVGSHPHVVQDLRVIQPVTASDRARLVAYSLATSPSTRGGATPGRASDCGCSSTPAACARLRRCRSRRRPGPAG